MKYSLYFISVILLILAGCSNNNPVSPELQDNTGSIILKIDRQNAPVSVAAVTAKLTRIGFNPVISEMNLLSDSTADLSMNNIPVGLWHLKIDAKNQAGVVEYSGETDVTILENTTIQITLTLYPVSGGTGGIYIFVTWGTNNTSWKDWHLNPVLTTFQNPSNPLYVIQPSVLYDNGIYKMWYIAGYNSAVASIWYAESIDGKTWNTVGNQPVLSKGPYGSWDSYSVGVDHVMKDDSLFKMYYVGYNSHPNNTTWKMGLAISSDGKVWEKHPQPVLVGTGSYYRVGLTSVVKHNGLYYGYFGYENNTYTETYIGAATSPDGVNWTFHNGNPIISATNPWEGSGIGFPTAIYENGKFKLIYNDKQQSAFGYAESSDGLNFIKNAVPFFKKSHTSKNWSYICYPMYYRKDNEHRIYYNGFNGNVQDGISFIYK
jgi:beta-1,2-mannobiose phosphorylase / 1,2-beta-oligomannan phosphorylase